MGSSASKLAQAAEVSDEDMFPPSPSSYLSPTTSLSPFSSSPRSTPDSTPPSSSGTGKVDKSTMLVGGPLNSAITKINRIPQHSPLDDRNGSKRTSEDELCRLTATQALTKVRRGEVSVEDWAISLLARIDERDRLVRAWVYLDRERVISEARRLDRVPKCERGPLHGVPIAIKDVIYTKDMPTKHNSPLYKDSFPEVDAASVTMLREAGALIFGKTTTSEFAAIYHGPKTYNPHSLPPFPVRTPGGSSSGSGASVGDFQIPIALATQTGGSTIRPASYNGIYGIKPTWGAVSREGQKLYSITLDTLGIYARGVEDLEMMLEGFGVWDDEMDPTLQDVPVLGESEEDPHKAQQQKELEEARHQIRQQTEFAMEGEDSVRGKKFAVCKTTLWPFAGPGTQQALQKAVELLRSHGAIVEEIDLPSEFNSLPEWYRVILYTEGRQAFYPDYVHATNVAGRVKHMKEQMSGPNGFGDGLKSNLLHDEIIGHVENVYGFTKRQQLDALDGVARLRPWMDEILSGYAALLTPSAVDEAPLGIESTGNSVFCCNWTTLHTPVVNIPGFQGENGLPIGVSLVAARYRDRHLLRVSKAVGKIFEEEGGWKRNL